MKDYRYRRWARARSSQRTSPHSQRSAVPTIGSRDQRGGQGFIVPVASFARVARAFAHPTPPSPAHTPPFIDRGGAPGKCPPTGKQGTTAVTNETSQEMTAEAYLTRLGERGIDYVFANAGTDFAPVVEAISRKSNNAKYPRFITVPHENVAMAMAHGYYRTCGKPAAVMVHVTVGTANAICGLMNAARDNIPLLLAAGRTPITETGHVASRNRSIHWGQESFDQGGMVREFVKWDYELRAGQPVESVVDRALDIAMTEPRGPVYLTLPREVLANPATHSRRSNIRPLGVAAPEPARAAIDQAAAMIAKAEFPLIVTSTIGRDPAAVVELAKLADEFTIPVVQAEARDFNLPTDHPMHLGFEAGPWVKKADVVIVLDSVIP